MGTDKIVTAAFDFDTGKMVAFQRTKPEAGGMDAHDPEHTFGKEEIVGKKMEGNINFVSVLCTENLPVSETYPNGGNVQIAEFLSEGNLEKAVGSLSANQKFTMLDQLMGAMKDLHEAGVSHGDINRLDNIMLAKDTNGDYVAKVIDFGNAQSASFGDNQKIVEDRQKSDLKHFGQTMYRLLTGEHLDEEGEGAFKRVLGKTPEGKMAMLPRQVLPDEPDTSDPVGRMIYQLLEGQITSFDQAQNAWNSISAEDRAAFKAPSSTV